MTRLSRALDGDFIKEGEGPTRRRLRSHGLLAVMISPHGLQAILIQSAALDGDRSPGRHGVRLADPRVGVRASPGVAGVAVHLDGEVCCHGRVLSFSTTAAFRCVRPTPKS